MVLPHCLMHLHLEMAREHEVEQVCWLQQTILRHGAQAFYSPSAKAPLIYDVCLNLLTFHVTYQLPLKILN